jgi:hypothetical protein
MSSSASPLSQRKQYRRASPAATATVGTPRRAGLSSGVLSGWRNIAYRRVRSFRYSKTGIDLPFPGTSRVARGKRNRPQVRLQTLLAFSDARARRSAAEQRFGEHVIVKGARRYVIEPVLHICTCVLCPPQALQRFPIDLNRRPPLHSRHPQA